jgi:Recombinase
VERKQSPPGDGLLIRRTRDFCHRRKNHPPGGNPNVGKMNTEAAAARDAKLKPVLEAMRGKLYREIAEGLTSRNIPTPRGGDAWNAMSVMRVMKRLRIAGK